jgi:valyl-tRNA synthetase
MEKNFNFSECEKRLNERWLTGQIFRANVNKNKKPYTIVMPPPNITSRLHIGHAFDLTIIDSIIRFKRMQGYETLMLPGADHAAIATEVKVVEELKRQGIDKDDLTREQFLEHIDVWYKKYTAEICGQFKRLGLSCDWSRFTFTMDSHSKNEVTKAFNRLHKDGFIYKGDRMINWCPSCKTALSDAEVEYTEISRPIWTVKYGGISVATTRPETMFGDVAVAVNPDDKRYKHLIGETIPLPLTDRKIPVIADSSVDIKFGTGAVKITPAHDHADYEIGQRHNLPAIKVIDDKGLLFGEYAGKYAGMTIHSARAKVVADLQDIGVITNVTNTISNIGECYRCHTAVEPTISKQWFVKMKELAEPAVAALTNEEDKLTIYPKKFQKIYLHWLTRIKDWCISRQLTSGHRIPVEGETDVLDTWFSSALWPFLTLNKNKADYEYFYPTQTMVTAYDIIFFWVIRMVFSGLYHTKKLPFGTVLLHGLVRDSQGRKMSKSLGNGIDPITIIEKYGADVLRYSLLAGSRLDRDPRYGEERAVKTRNFINKIWNATKFVLAHKDNSDLVKIHETFLKLIHPVMPFITQEIWEIMGHITEIAYEPFPAPEKIKSKKISANKTAAKEIFANKAAAMEVSAGSGLDELNKIIKSTAKHYEKYEYGVAAAELQTFFWAWFCDIYIEQAKGKSMTQIKQKRPPAPDKAKQIAFLQNEIVRGEQLLANAGFIAKAPQKLIKTEREKLAKNKEELYNAKRNA